MSIDYLRGYIASVENSKNLNKIATLSFHQGAHGIASSLNVLACEELIKAISFLTKHYFPDSELHESDKVFRDHKHKHEHLGILSFVFFLKQIMFMSWTEQFDEFEEFYEEVKAAPRNENEALIVKQIEWAKNSDISPLVVAKWLKNANDLKNNGFYVGLKDAQFHIPQEMSDEQYKVGQKFHEMLVGYLEMLEFTFAKTDMLPIIKDKMKEIENLPFLEKINKVLGPTLD